MVHKVPFPPFVSVNALPFVPYMTLPDPTRAHPHSSLTSAAQATYEALHPPPAKVAKEEEKKKELKVPTPLKVSE